jgi:DNA-binding MarR family transcriptional regulator
MEESRWLDETQQEAWRALLVLFNRGFPELERTLKANDLLTIQYGILTELSEAPNRTLGLSELAELANTSQSRLTHRLRDLVSRGEVGVSPCSTDGRAKNATLTDAGQSRLDSVSPQHALDVLRVFFDPLDTKQTKAMADALSQIAANLCCQDRFRQDRSSATKRNEAT